MKVIKTIIVMSILAGIHIQSYAADSLVKSKPQTVYKIEVQNSDKVVIYNGTLSDSAAVEQLDQTSYTDNCLLDKDNIAEISKSNIKTGLVAKIDKEKSLMVLEFTQLLENKKTLITEPGATTGCYIQEPVIGTYTFTQETPFFMADNTIHLVNQKDLSVVKKPYYLKINRVSQ